MDGNEALAVGRWVKGLPKLPGGLTWKRGGSKYLGVHLGDETAMEKKLERWNREGRGETEEVKMVVATNVLQRKNFDHQ